MKQKLGFKKSLRDTLIENNRATEFYAAMAGKPAVNLAPIKPKRPTRIDAHDIDAIHKTETQHRPLEADVIAAVSDILKAHPRVLWAVRMNSGAASYEAASGRYAPVYFHRWIRGSGYRMSDFLGATNDFRILALEAKKPGWTKPTDQREREQATFLECVVRNGGRAGFVRNAQEALAIIEAELA